MMLRQIPVRRLIKFAIVGGTTLAIDFAVYYMLTRFGDVPYLASRTISIALALCWNFTVNRHWTFRATAGKVSQQMPRYVIVMGATSLLNLALMRVGVSYLHQNDLFVLVVVALTGAMINFSAHSLWSYRLR